MVTKFSYNCKQRMRCSRRSSGLLRSWLEKAERSPAKTELWALVNSNANGSIYGTVEFLVVAGCFSSALLVLQTNVAMASNC